MNEDCIFCNIINDRMPSMRVYEDSSAIAFLDIAPVVKGHVLVIPRDHYDPITATPETILEHLIKVVKRVARAQVTGLSADGVNVSQANGRCAGQVVPHLHFHVIPRFGGSPEQSKWTPKKYEDKKEMESFARKIRAALQ